MIIQSELPLPHNAVTAKARVLDEAFLFRMEGLRLARQLGKEDRVTPGQAHRRCTPCAVGRQVLKLIPVRIVRRQRLGHVELQAGSACIVAADALVGRDVLAFQAGAVTLPLLHPDIVISR